MASMVENSNGSDSEAAIPSQVTLDGTESSIELGDGRVWRRGNIASTADKQKNIGPVLRTTVKPVKRFRPDSISDKTNPSPNRKKRWKHSGSSVISILKSDDSAHVIQSEEPAKTKASFLTSTVLAPEQKVSPECGKTEKSNGSETQGEDRRDAPVKKKRVWEQWSVEDKNYFFEAVAMYGKDFEAIRTAIAQKHRKKGEECLAKTKDQVRHLYYRTWTMISKIIETDAYPLNLNKAYQELYAVINYGELRKKLGGNLKKKGIEKLNELIRDGTTSARSKGKNFRIKTPSCRALKKMSPQYQAKEGVNDMPLVSDTRRMKIPLRVTIELCPLTMGDWSQVHSVAHNPRLRVRLSVESELSVLFGFLERKWKPLSGRIQSFVEQRHTKADSALHNMPTSQVSKQSDILLLQTPSDVSVNTRIMVFQVANNKTHCIVSYALRKSAQISGKQGDTGNVVQSETRKIEDCEVEELIDTKAQPSGCMSESEAVDSCLSSEEDYDYDSATEDTSKEQNNSDCFPKRSPVNGVQSLDTTFTLKDKESASDSPSSDTPGSRDEKDFGDVTAKPATPCFGRVSIGIFDQYMVDKANEEVQAEMLEENNLQNEGCTFPKHSANVEINTVNDDSAVFDSAPTFLDQEQLQAKRTKKRKKMLVSSKLFDESLKGKRQKSTRRNKSFIKMVQKWTANDCGKTTVAEVYMMLGKPSVFKLCYHWLKKASQTIDSAVDKSCECPSDDRNINQSFPLSTGLTALVQAASLSNGDHGANKCGTDVCAQCIPKVMPKTKSAAVQCDIIKSSVGADERSRSQVPAAYSSSNPHGRGVSKILPVETVIVNNLPISGFAVPSVPINRPRRIAANPNKPVQGTKVSAETMNWLLQRERSRSNRMLRRPIVVDRSSNQRSSRVGNRPMKTFSIITKGPNKIGFLPSQPMFGPRLASNHPESGSESTTSIEKPQIAENLALNSLDKLLNDSFGDEVNRDLSSDNLLMQAAKEAGVTPPTPNKAPVDQPDKDTRSVSLSPVAGPLPESSVSLTAHCSVPVVFSMDPTQTSKGVVAGEYPIIPGPSVVSTVHEVVSQDKGAPCKSPMVYSFSTLGSSPTTLSSSSLDVNPAVVNSLPELSWPGNDIYSSAFPIMNETFIDKLVDEEEDALSCLSQKQTKLVDEGSGSSMLQTTPVKSAEMPVHPWTINTNSRESVGLSHLLNTPQKILLSDTEDSLYAVGAASDLSPLKNKNPIACEVKGLSQDSASSSFVSGADSAVDINLQSLINENSVDLVSKFQDLVRHTTDCDEMSGLAGDENARDGHLREDVFQGGDLMANIADQSSR